MNPALPRAIPFVVFIGFLSLDPMLGGLARSLDLDPKWWYAVRVAVVAGVLGSFRHHYVELGSVRGVRAREWLVAIALGVAVWVLWINLDFPPVAFGRSRGFEPRTVQGAIDWSLAAARLAGATLVVPVMEELFWRSFVMRWIQKRDFLAVNPRSVGLCALGVSSVLFALEHHLWFAGLLAGLGYGGLYRFTSNLWPSILAHAVTNGLLGAWVLYTASWALW